MLLRADSRCSVAALAVTGGTATACTDVDGTNGKNFVTGNGRVLQIDPGDRGDPVDAGGETLDGDQLQLADLRGKVVVVNVWGAWCTECRTETPILVDAADELPNGATIVGIDVRDSSKDDALAYVRVGRDPLPLDLRPRQRAAAAVPAAHQPPGHPRAPSCSTPRAGWPR